MTMPEHIPDWDEMAGRFAPQFKCWAMAPTKATGAIVVAMWKEIARLERELKAAKTALDSKGADMGELHAQNERLRSAICGALGNMAPELSGCQCRDCRVKRLLREASTGRPACRHGTTTKISGTDLVFCHECGTQLTHPASNDQP